MKTRIFLSYAHKNTAKVLPVVQELEKLGFDVWIDKYDLKGGELWSGEIARAISRCHHYVLFISRASIRSDSIRREVDLAYTSKRRMILVRLDAAEIPAEIAFQTSGVQWIDARDQDWMSRLLVALGSKAHAPSMSRPKNTRSKPRAKKEAQSAVQIKGNAAGNIIIVGDDNTVNHDDGR
ncbi:MAG: toll/interleukin-1 receptor domain-containing protein [Anaerolineales bacterium]